MPNRPMPRNMRPIPPNLRLTGAGDGAEPNCASEPRREVSQAPPPVPSWLTVNAAPHWEMVAAQMVAERIWRPCFMTSLGTYCELLAVFLSDPQSFGPSKLGQLRLLAGDLGLTPSHLLRVARTHQ